MLRELRITNVAIIDAVELSFAPGMNVLTGETGAGKSIITRAIGLLCGGRATADLIRADAAGAEIEGLFDLEERDGAVLAESGLPVSEEMLVRRVISRSGKGRVYVNGNLVTAGMLSRLGCGLIHVYGQHEQALLLKADSHLELLDEFGKLAATCGRMQRAYAAFHDAAGQLAALTAGAETARQRLELLRFQVKELRGAQLARGEPALLQQERNVQRYAAKLSQICASSEEALYSSDAAVIAGLARIATQLQEAARIDPLFGPMVETLHQSAAQLEEVALELRRAAARIHHDPDRLAEIEDRLALLTRLTRKYDCEADELLQHLARMEAELASLERTGVNASAVRQEVRERAADAWGVARELSRMRQAAAVSLDRRMAEELRALGMQGAAFRTVLTVAAADGPQPGPADPGTAGLSAAGADMVQFYLSTNPGEEPKPLARIASGGELSRIMLALKALTAAAGEVPTLIFDEVDAGIGGAVAEAVGRRLRALGRARQILCITHLPQIAAQADHHFAVEKHVARGRTTTSARRLANDERVGELTRMLGGASAESQRLARRLLERVNTTQRNG
ncbi:MAG: DNA repair protein RecN [Candidatus Binatia bacterium]